MHNELFSIGPFTVYGYGLMIAIGIFSAYCLAEYRARKIGLDDERVFGLTIWAVIGGIAGGKILYYLTILPQIAADPSLLYRDLMEGFVIYGALIGGFIGIVLYCRHWKMNVLSYLDLALPSVALAQGFGRIGCLLAGCCYGQETDSAFCIVFQNSAYAPNGVPLIPTQIISSALDFLHFGLLILFAKDGRKGKARWPAFISLCTARDALFWNSSGEIWSGEMWERCLPRSLSPYLPFSSACSCFSGQESMGERRLRKRLRIQEK